MWFEFSLSVFVHQNTCSFLYSAGYVSRLISVSKLCRSYGRAPKMIHLESNFVQFKEELLPKEGNKALLTFPFLHIYWTECCVSIRKISWKTEYSDFKMKWFWLSACPLCYFWFVFHAYFYNKSALHKHAYPMYWKWNFVSLSTFYHKPYFFVLLLDTKRTGFWITCFWYFVTKNPKI